MITPADQQSMLDELSHAFTAIPFNHMLGLSLQQMDAKEVIMRFDMKKELIGNFLHQILHGGVISSVLDMAGGMVVMASAVYKNTQHGAEKIKEIIAKCSTIDLQISFLSPGRGEFFIAKSWLIKSGKNISFARMELYNQDKGLIASANGTYRLRMLPS